MKWTDDQDQQLRELHHQGLPNREVALWLHRSERAIKNRINFLGLHPAEAMKNRPPAIGSEKNQELILQEETQQQVALLLTWEEIDNIELIRLVPQLPLTSIAIAMDKPFSQIKHQLKVLLECGRITPEMRYRRSHKGFTKQDLEYIKNSYPETCIEDIADTLNKPITTIRNRLLALGLLERDHRHTWTKEEDELLTRLYLQGETLEYMVNTTKRTYPAVRGRINVLALMEKYGNFSPQHLETSYIDDVKRLQPYYHMDKIALQLKKRKAFVRESVQYMLNKKLIEAVEVTPVPSGWTMEQFKQLLECIPHEDAASIAEKLGKSIQQVRSVATRRKLPLKLSSQITTDGPINRGKTRWKQEELEYLISKSEDHSIADIANLLGRTPMAVYLQCQSLGLKQNERVVVWTVDQDELLTTGYLQGDTIPTLAAKLNKTEAVVVVRILNLNLRERLKKEFINGLTTAYIDEVKRLYGFYSTYQIAAMLNKGRKFVGYTIRYMLDHQLLQMAPKITLPKSWSPEDYQMLLITLNALDFSSLAERINKTPQQIKHLITRRKLLPNQI